MEMDEFIKYNYLDLKWRSSKVVTSKKWPSKNPKSDADELLSFLFLYLYENINRMIDYNEKQVYNFCTMFLNSQWVWKDSEFRCSRRNIHKKKDVIDYMEDSVVGDSYSYQDHYWENVSEKTPENIKNYVQELCNQGMSNDHIKKVCASLMSRELLEYHEQSLFDLYFIDNLSTREIADRCKIPNTSVHLMLVDLKKKIRLSAEDMIKNNN